MFSHNFASLSPGKQKMNEMLAGNQGTYFSAPECT
jgi:hypothetical protein